MVFLSDWLRENKLSVNFELLEVEELADLLRKMYGTVLARTGKEYSKSGMINLRAGINRYLQQPPQKRILDIMNDRPFLQANKVFSGRLRDNKERGLDTSQPRQPIDQHDMEKLFREYFTPGIEKIDTQVLVHKIFFDVVYYTGRRAKEGLRELSKNSFEVKVGSDNKEYIEITFNEKTKKNQGDDTSTSKRALHNNHHIISAQDNVLCPVKSFKTYMALLHKDCSAFFQYPSKDRNSYQNACIGKNPLGDMMKQISKYAKLSQVYTNHQIRKTTATALYRSGFGLKEITHVTKHKNIDSLKHYVGGPTYEDKKSYNDALLKYAENSNDSQDTAFKRKIDEGEDLTRKRIVTEKTVVAPITYKTKESTPDFHENVPEDRCLVPMYPSENESQEEKETQIIPASNQQSVVNQLRQGSHLFQNASFANCNFTFQMPK